MCYISSKDGTVTFEYDSGSRSVVVTVSDNGSVSRSIYSDTETGTSYLHGEEKDEWIEKADAHRRKGEAINDFINKLIDIEGNVIELKEALKTELDEDKDDDAWMCLEDDKIVSFNFEDIEYALKRYS